MPTHQNEISVPANATVNLMANSQYEWLPWPALLELGLMANATGLQATIQSGSDVLSEEGLVPFNATAGLYPKYPDDYHWSDEAAAGDRIKVNCRNTTGAAIPVRIVAKLSPLI